MSLNNIHAMACIRLTCYCMSIMSNFKLVIECTRKSFYTATLTHLVLISCCCDKFELAVFNGCNTFYYKTNAVVSTVYIHTHSYSHCFQYWL